MNSQIGEALNMLTKELNILLDAITVEEVLYGLIAYLHNGLVILDNVMARLGDK